MKQFTYNFKIKFIDSRTGELRETKREYTAEDFEQAKRGIFYYCKDNKTMKRFSIQEV